MYTYNTGLKYWNGLTYRWVTLLTSRFKTYTEITRSYESKQYIQVFRVVSTCIAGMRSTRFSLFDVMMWFPQAAVH